MTARGLDKKVVAAQLYPRLKHPLLAFNRAIKGISSLSDAQKSKLALLADLSPAALYEAGKWQVRSKENVITFLTEEYRAELDTSTFVTRLFHNKSLFHETVLAVRGIALPDFLAVLNAQILKFRANE